MSVRHFAMRDNTTFEKSKRSYSVQILTHGRYRGEVLQSITTSVWDGNIALATLDAVRDISHPGIPFLNQISGSATTLFSAEQGMGEPCIRSIDRII